MPHPILQFVLVSPLAASLGILDPFCIPTTAASLLVSLPSPLSPRDSSSGLPPPRTLGHHRAGCCRGRRRISPAVVEGRTLSRLFCVSGGLLLLCVRSAHDLLDPPQRQGRGSTSHPRRRLDSNLNGAPSSTASSSPTWLTSSASDPRRPRSLTASWRRPAATLFPARRRILMEQRSAPPPSLALLAESGRSWRSAAAPAPQSGGGRGRASGGAPRRSVVAAMSSMLSFSSRESQLPPDAHGVAGDCWRPRLFLLFPFFIGDADAEYCWRRSKINTKT